MNASISIIIRNVKDIIYLYICIIIFNLKHYDLLLFIHSYSDCFKYFTMIIPNWNNIMSVCMVDSHVTDVTLLNKVL